MQYAHIVLGVLGLIVSLAAMLVAIAPRKSDSSSRIRQLEVQLTELEDSFDYMSVSLKKLHGRKATRESRDAPPVVDAMDPMKRLPGETGEEWKARMGRTLAGVSASSRRN
jgi:hypothetical protein